MQTIFQIYPHPFISHATKDLTKFESILKHGKISSARKLLKEGLIKKEDMFAWYGDNWVKRTNKVMLSIGMGYIKTNPNMLFSFLFSINTLKYGSEIHLTSPLYEKCNILAEYIRKQNESGKFAGYWTLYFNTKELSRYNNPYLKRKFSEYMIEFLKTGKLNQEEVWGPSAYPEGLKEICLKINPDPYLKKEIIVRMAEVDAKLILKGKHQCNNYLSSIWGKHSEHTQVLIPRHITLWTSNLIGIAVRPGYENLLKTTLIKYKPPKLKINIYNHFGEYLFQI